MAARLAHGTYTLIALFPSLYRVVTRVLLLVSRPFSRLPQLLRQIRDLLLQSLNERPLIRRPRAELFPPNPKHPFRFADRPEAPPQFRAQATSADAAKRRDQFTTRATDAFFRETMVHLPILRLSPTQGERVPLRGRLAPGK